MRVWILATLALLICWGAAYSQGPVPVGEEFQVAAYTNAVNASPAVAMDAEDNFIVVWGTGWAVYGEGAPSDIKGRRYDASGVPLGPQFTVNSVRSVREGSPAVTAGRDGEVFVAWVSGPVLWGSDGSYGTDTDRNSIQAIRYDANGARLGWQFQVNSYTTDDQDGVAVAADPLGNFVVVWESDGSYGTDTDRSSIQVQRYDANATPIGGQFQVNSYTTGSQRGPAAEVDAQGNFIVVWTSDGSYGTDTSSRSIQAQRYDADGAPIGGQFQVNSYTTDWQSRPSVGADAQGNFIVVWGSSGSYGTDSSSGSIQAQRYDANGTPIGGQFQINSFTTHHQSGPLVAVEPQGNFVVVWGSNGSYGTDTSNYSIQGQGFDAAGVPTGTQFQVNTYTTNYQWQPSVATSAQGDFVVVWRSSGIYTYTVDNSTINGQRYSAGHILIDGFESGDMSAWSSTVP